MVRALPTVPQLLVSWRRHSCSHEKQVTAGELAPRRHPGGCQSAWAGSTAPLGPHFPAGILPQFSRLLLEKHLPPWKCHSASASNCWAGSDHTTSIFLLYCHPPFLWGVLTPSVGEAALHPHIPQPLGPSSSPDLTSCSTSCTNQRWA